MGSMYLFSHNKKISVSGEKERKPNSGRLSPLIWIFLLPCKDTKDTNRKAYKT